MLYDVLDMLLWKDLAMYKLPLSTHTSDTFESVPQIFKMGSKNVCKIIKDRTLIWPQEQINFNVIVTFISNKATCCIVNNLQYWFFYKILARKEILSD